MTATLPRPKTLDELYDDLMHVEGKAEIINGRIVRFMSSGVDPNLAAGEIFASLRDYMKHTGRGRAFTDNIGFRVNIPNRNSFSPDASYVADKPVGMKFYNGAPVFAAEVRSENDYGPAADSAILAKIADYFAAGTLVVWDVDLRSPDTIKVYRASAPTAPAIYRRGDLAEAEPAVPGWTLQVDELWA